MRGSPTKWQVLNLPLLGRLLESPYSLPTLAAALGKFVSSQIPRVAATFSDEVTHKAPCIDALGEQVSDHSIQA